MMKPRRLRLIAVLLILAPCCCVADEVRIATASNFRHAMIRLAAQFEAESGHEITPIFGSTGKHFAQILHGAPFDAFFAADAERPFRLEQEGRVIAGSRFTYATGKLALWSRTENYVDSTGDVLTSGDFRHLAIANPKLAPYGRAAREVLVGLGAWGKLEGRLVSGENVAQAFQFVQSGNAELGFVAWAQLLQDGQIIDGSYWLVPGSMHQPIEQEAVLLKDSQAGRDFMYFVRSARGAGIIQSSGYETP
jgi:molybdate transport system substrate-binding protein